jgi:hypothetical protein
MRPLTGFACYWAVGGQASQAVVALALTARHHCEQRRHDAISPCWRDRLCSGAVGIRVLLGIGGNWRTNIPLSACAVVFIGNVLALTMCGLQLRPGNVALEIRSPRAWPGR